MRGAALTMCARSQIRLQADALVIVEGVYHKVLSRDDARRHAAHARGEARSRSRRPMPMLADLYFGEPRRLQLVEGHRRRGSPKASGTTSFATSTPSNVRQQDAALMRLDYVQACEPVLRRADP